MSVHLESPVWLFCPADRPERYERALASAGVVIFDLEDAVALEAKAGAREGLVRAAAELDPSRVIVRVNPAGSADGTADIDALQRTRLRTVMLPKVESPTQVEALGGFEVVALCESASGVHHAPDIARASNCVAITWGGQDLALDLGATGTRDERGAMLPFATHARTSIRYAAAAARLPAVDTVWISIDDLDGLRAEARGAAEQGFSGKMVIHPSHVEVVREAFRPTAAQIEAAERVVAAVEGAGSGAVAAEGQMLDRPVVEQARRLLRRAGETRR
jgi:citrate lyase subunit beta / citryl-CoA lyase